LSAGSKVRSRDCAIFPAAVRGDIGQALYAAQAGKTDPAAKPLRGFGGLYGSVSGCDLRLHVFQKKSTKGIATPTREIEMIQKRLSEAERD
jgi:phage-related protein